MKPFIRHYTVGVLGTLTILATLAGCATGDGNPTGTGLQREGRLQLREQLSTRQDVVSLLGKPYASLDMPRLAVQRTIRDKCMQWDQRTIRSLIYLDTYRGKEDGRTRGQETQVFLNADDRVCSWGVWTWLKDFPSLAEFQPKG